jgi:hypothetical protein
MRRIRRAWGLTVVTAGLQLACPLWAQAEDAAALVRPNVTVPLAMRDLQLDALGTLRGQVLTPEGAPLVDAKVALSQVQQPVAETATDKDGRFQLSGLRGGTYELRTGSTSTWVRLWKYDAAPPAAKTDALVVAERPTIRGQINYMNSNMLLPSEAIGTLMIPAAVAGGVIALKQHHEQDNGS